MNRWGRFARRSSEGAVPVAAGPLRPRRRAGSVAKAGVAVLVAVAAAMGLGTAVPRAAANPAPFEAPMVRYAGPDRFATAVEISKHTFSDDCGCVAYVANAYNFPDALAGAAAAGKVKGPVLLAAATGALDASTVAELQRLKPTKIIVLGGTAAISDAVATALAAYVTGGATNVARYSGADRFATAAQISLHTFADDCGCVAYIANAYNFPDALAGAAAAGKINGPVLLAATSGTLDPSTVGELQRLKPTKIIVLGGTAAISDAVATALAGYVTGGATNVARYSGADRFATAAKISQNTFPPNCACTVYIANAYNFPDALAGAAAAGEINGPVLLAATTGIPTDATIAELQRLQPARIVVLGGMAAISGQTYTWLRQYVLPASAFVATTNSLTTGRSGHTATTLKDGRVLVTGGYMTGGVTTTSAEIYSPLSGLFSAATGPMSTARVGHTATLLPDGRVLIAGGWVSTGPTNSAEIFDPTTGTFTATTGTMKTARVGQTATLLSTGKVLLVGGMGSSFAPLASAEIFDPSTGTFAYTAGNLHYARQGQAAELLGNGQVLVVGGWGPGTVALSSAELFNPSNGTFSVTGSMHVVRSVPTATRLPDGRVLVAGGLQSMSAATNTAETYNPTTGSFTYTTGTMSVSASTRTATLLPDGRVLLTGGAAVATSTTTAASDLFDPATNTFDTGPQMSSTRVSHSASLLADGRVLIVGGDGTAANYYSSAELFIP